MSTTDLAWFKSSYSSGSGDSCVEVATCPDTVHVRDSKIEEGPQLTLSPPPGPASSPTPPKPEVAYGRYLVPLDRPTRDHCPDHVSGACLRPRCTLIASLPRLRTVPRRGRRRARTAGP